LIGVLFVDVFDEKKGVEYGELMPVEDGSIEQEQKCLNCNRRWMDVFRLVEVHELCGSKDE
jgi:hypothetical protein